MKLSLNSEAERQIADRIRSGKYATAEEVVTAALHALEHDENTGEFAHGEWDSLLAEGEASGDALNGETVLKELRDLRMAQRQGNRG